MVDVVVYDNNPMVVFLKRESVFCSCLAIDGRGKELSSHDQDIHIWIYIYSDFYVPP